MYSMRFVCAADTKFGEAYFTIIKLRCTTMHRRQNENIVIVVKHIIVISYTIVDVDRAGANETWSTR